MKKIKTILFSLVMMLSLGVFGQVCDNQLISINLGTGLNENYLPIINSSGQPLSNFGSIDTHWKLISNAILVDPCTSNLRNTINGNAYLVNHNNVPINSSNWINQTDVVTIAPIKGSNYTTFNCNNGFINNNRVPYIFGRNFCVCENGEYNINLSLKADDIGWIEIFNRTTQQVVFTSNKYTFNISVFNPLIITNTLNLTNGNYQIKVYIENTNSTTVGFSLKGNIESKKGKLSLSDCYIPTPNTSNVTINKILDNNQNNIFDSGDLLGANWEFEVKNRQTNSINRYITDSFGRIVIPELAYGDYEIKEIPKEGWNCSSPINGIFSLSLNSNFYEINFYNRKGNSSDCQCPEFGVINLSDNTKSKLAKKEEYKCGSTIQMDKNSSQLINFSFNCFKDARFVNQVVLPNGKMIEGKSKYLDPIAMQELTKEYGCGVYKFKIDGYCCDKLCSSCEIKVNVTGCDTPKACDVECCIPSSLKLANTWINGSETSIFYRETSRNVTKIAYEPTQEIVNLIDSYILQMQSNIIAQKCENSVNANFQIAYKLYKYNGSNNFSDGQQIQNEFSTNRNAFSQVATLNNYRTSDLFNFSFNGDFTAVIEIEMKWTGINNTEMCNTIVVGALRNFTSTMRLNPNTTQRQFKKYTLQSNFLSNQKK